MTTFLDQEPTPAVAWEGYLEPTAETLRSNGRLPRVSLGQPAYWHAAAAFQSELGQSWTPPDPALTYTLIRLSCTLHPPSEAGDRYTELKLDAPLRLLNRSDVGRPVAHDLFPLRQTVTESGKFSLGLTPEFKFAKAIELKLVELGVEKAYTAVFPVIQAYDLGGHNPYWQIEAHPQFPLQGSQKLYLIAAAPVGQPLRLHLSLAATIEHRRWGIIRYGQPQTANARLTFTIPAE